MVHGINKIREYLGKYPDQYCIIGGTACDLIMEDLGRSFRLTKDMDIVLVAEAITEDFWRDLWRLIEAGGYESRMKSNDKKELYRFAKPHDASFPYMIELFSRCPDSFTPWPSSHLVPLHLGDDIPSLSAILMDDEYYALFMEGKKQVDGISILSEEYLILLKMKAYIDFRTRIAQGEKHSHDLKKHKNDVFRLLEILAPGSKIPISKSIQDDVAQFRDLIMDDPVDLKSLGINSLSMDEAMDLFIRTYLNQSI